MPIREESFRIGCGRYLQKPNLLKECGSEITRVGQAPLIVGGKTALELTREKIQNSISKSCERYEIVEYCGTCNEEYAEELAKVAKQKQYDVIVGVGGGVLMDYAKLVGDFAGLPVINIPTSSATCAAYAPLSVRYTPEGRTVGSKHYAQEVSAVLVDSTIISAQPTRLFLSGVFDALAKFVEIKQRFNESTTDYPLGLDWAYALSKKSFDELMNKTEACIGDMRRGNISNTVEQVIFCTIAATGVISGIARGSNQCALAHKFYESARSMFFEESRSYLHGEIVGVGLLLQNFFNGETENNHILLSIMKKYNMPCCVSDIGIEPTEETQEMFYQKLKSSSAIDENNSYELEKLSEGLKYLWSIR